MKLLKIGLVGLAAAMLTLSTAGAADKAKKVETQGKTARGDAAATDPNIKSKDIPANEPSKAEAKKAEQQRGVCRITVDSYRDLYIKIYVDGDYKGVLSPRATDYTYAISGTTRLYARADFTDGTYVYWGPEVFNCESGGSYTWTLR